MSPQAPECQQAPNTRGMIKITSYIIIKLFHTSNDKILKPVREKWHIFPTGAKEG